MSARITTGNSSPFALCTVISRTPSLPSSRIGASAAWPPSACSRSSSTKPRNDMPPFASYCRASSATCSTLASACSPAGRSTNPTCARVAFSSCGDGVGDRPVVAPRDAAAAAAQRVGDRLRARGSSVVRRRGTDESAVRRCRYSSSVSSSIANSAPRSVANTDSSSSGHSIGRERRADRLDFLASWNDLPPTSRCGTPRASSAST